MISSRFGNRGVVDSFPTDCPPLTPPRPETVRISHTGRQVHLLYPGPHAVPGAARSGRRPDHRDFAVRPAGAAGGLRGRRHAAPGPRVPGRPTHSDGPTGGRAPAGRRRDALPGHRRAGAELQPVHPPGHAAAVGPASPAESVALGGSGGLGGAGYRHDRAALRGVAGAAVRLDPATDRPAAPRTVRRLPARRGPRRGLRAVRWAGAGRDHRGRSDRPHRPSHRGVDRGFRGRNRHPSPGFRVGRPTRLRTGTGVSDAPTDRAHLGRNRRVGAGRRAHLQPHRPDPAGRARLHGRSELRPEQCRSHDGARPR